MINLDAEMQAFSRRHPVASLLLRYDPQRPRERYTATAYAWRGDGDTPTEALVKLIAVVDAHTIATLPDLGDGEKWVMVGRGYFPLCGGSSAAELPPPFSLVWSVEHRDEMLYVPEGT